MYTVVYVHGSAHNVAIKAFQEFSGYFFLFIYLPLHYRLGPIYNRLTADRFYARTPRGNKRAENPAGSGKKNRQRWRESCRFCKQASAAPSGIFSFFFFSFFVHVLLLLNVPLGGGEEEVPSEVFRKEYPL